jgi:hypothetical protein
MDERFYRGARPKAKDFQALKDLGIKTIIDLTDNTPEERGYAEAVGLHYVNIAIADKTDPTDAQIAQFLKLVNDPPPASFTFTARVVVTAPVSWAQYIDSIITTGALTRFMPR